MDDDHLQAKIRAVQRMAQTGGLAFSGMNVRRMDLAEIEAQELVKVRAERIEQDILDVAKQASERIRDAQEKALDTIKNTGTVVSRRALVSRNKGRWSSIEIDLTEASRNGLTNAASTGRNKWNEAAALEWADQQGKIARNRMADLPGIKVTQHR